MQRQVRLSTVAGLVVVAALILAACGGTTPTQCLLQANTSLGTISTGQVSIATDHSVYAPGDELQATIANHLSTSIVIGNDISSTPFPYFVLQRRVRNDWQRMPVCPTGGGDHGERTPQQRIETGGSFSNFVDLHTDLPAGTYRLWIASYIIKDAHHAVAGWGTTESATFRVCACRVCA